MEDLDEATKAQCLFDFIYFCEKVLGLEMTDYHKEVANAILANKFLCIVIPRSHGKTMLCTIAYPLWRLSRERDIEICITSSSRQMQSSKFFEDAKYILETNPFFRDLLPDNRKVSWNQTQITTTNHNRLFTAPFGSSFKGSQPDYIIYDDLLRDEVVNPKYVSDTFFYTFFPAGAAKGCRHLVVGTPQSTDDLYTELESKRLWKVMRKQAVIEDDKGNWVGVLWPSRFNLDYFRDAKDNMGEGKFEREFMCRPSTVGDVLYKQENILNALDYNLSFSSTIEGVPYIGADFAASDSGWADYNVFTVVDDMAGKTYTKKTDKGEVVIQNPIVIRNMLRFRGMKEQTAKLKNWYDIYHAPRVVADNGHVGSKFVKEMRDEAMFVEPQNFTPAERAALLNNLASVLEKGRLVIPASEEANPLTDILVRELSGFRLFKDPKTQYEVWKSVMKHDDTVFSLALAVKHASAPATAMRDLVFVA